MGWTRVRNNSTMGRIGREASIRVFWTGIIKSLRDKNIGSRFHSLTTDVTYTFIN